MDYQKLLFAAEVHNLAMKYFHNDEARFIREISGDEDLAPVRLKEWREENTVEKYVEIAYQEIIATAEQIDEIAAVQHDAAVSDALNNVISS